MKIGMVKGLNLAAPTTWKELKSIKKMYKKENPGR